MTALLRWMVPRFPPHLLKQNPCTPGLCNQVDESLQAIIASAPGATSATSTPWVAATEIDAALQQDFDAAFIKKHFGISEAEISMYGTCTWKALQDAMLSRLATKDL